MAKIAKHFEVTKHLPQQLGSIEFSGIVYKNDPENYDIETVLFSARGGINEDITQWFRAFRQLNDPFFHHEDIVELLTDFLSSQQKIAA